MKEQFSDAEVQQFEKAKEFSREGNLEGQLNIMEGLVMGNPRSALFRAVLANTFWDLGNIVKAEGEFRLAIQLSPKSEKFSLGLFHCLWEQNKTKEAFEERERFTNLVDHSQEYEEMRNDLESFKNN
ncbi:MAG: hypothetical protein ABJF50_07595 [Paracoccaceae bacterium]